MIAPPRIDDALLMAGGKVEMWALARKCQKIFMAVLSTSAPGESVSQNPTVQIAVDRCPQIGTIKPIGSLKALLSCWEVHRPSICCNYQTLLTIIIAGTTLMYEISIMAQYQFRQISNYEDNW